MSPRQPSDLLLVNAERGFFGQERKPWISMDVPLLASTLKALGYAVRITDIGSLALQAGSIKDQTIFYAFSQREHLRAYIKDVMQVLNPRNRIIPSLPLLLCHENKGYAELYRQQLGISSPSGHYINDAGMIPTLKLTYPIVLKTIAGTNARGVTLCQSEADLLKAVKSLSSGPGLFNRIDHLRRKHLRKGRTYEGYPDFAPQSDADAWLEYMTPKTSFVLQEFIPGLDCDYRVIAIQGRYYVMQRLVNKGDFRASGTKRFVFDAQVPDDLLDYAEDTFRKFDTPFLSMDIGHSSTGNHLFEFQALHFGTAAIVRSQGFYQRMDGGWQFVRAQSKLEETLADGLHRYLSKSE